MTNKLTQTVFDGVGVNSVKKYLDLAAVQHRLVSRNVANVSTPGYKSRNIDFQSEFNRANGKTTRLEGVTTNPKHIPTGHHPKRGPKVNVAKVVDGDMNSVDIDREISNMAQNELLYTIGAQMLKGKFDSLRKAITSK
ncbi:MAG: flagellar basal body rod protein FlgB [Candidatus Zixiibacteriota bacterium]